MPDGAEVLQFLHHSLHARADSKSEAFKREDEGFPQKALLKESADGASLRRRATAEFSPAS